MRRLIMLGRMGLRLMCKLDLIVCVCLDDIIRNEIAFCS